MLCWPEIFIYALNIGNFNKPIDHYNGIRSVHSVSFCALLCVSLSLSLRFLLKVLRLSASLSISTPVLAINEGRLFHFGRQSCGGGGRGKSSTVRRSTWYFLCSRCHCTLRLSMAVLEQVFSLPSIFFFLSIIRFFRTWLVGVCTTVQQTGIALGIVDALEILELAKRKSKSGWQPGGNPTKSMLKSDDEVEQNWGKNGKRCWTRIESKFAEFVYKFDRKQKQIHLICWNSINIAICSAS